MSCLDPSNNEKHPAPPYNPKHNPSNHNNTHNSSHEITTVIAKMYYNTDDEDLKASAMDVLRYIN